MAGVSGQDTAQDYGQDYGRMTRYGEEPLHGSARAATTCFPAAAAHRVSGEHTSVMAPLSAQAPARGDVRRISAVAAEWVVDATGAARLFPADGCDGTRRCRRDFSERWQEYLQAGA